MFHLSIKTDNAAFTYEDETAMYAEVSRILTIVAERLAPEGIKDRIDTYKLYDVNGNRVGECYFD